MADPKHNQCIDALLRRVTDPGRVIDDLAPWHRDPGIGKALTLLTRTLDGDDDVVKIRAAELLLLIGKSQARAKQVLENNMQRCDLRCVAVIRALGHLGPESSWATERILQLWPEANPPAKEAIVDALWTIRPPVETVIRSLLGTDLEADSPLSVRVSNLLASYGRIAAGPLCKFLAEQPKSENTTLVWMSLRTIGWVRHGSGPWLMQNLHTAPHISTQFFGGLCRDCECENFAVSIYSWFDDPREALRLGLESAEIKVCLAAVKAIQRLKLPAADQLQLLLAVAGNRESLVRKAAWDALYTLTLAAPELVADVHAALLNAYHNERCAPPLDTQEYCDDRRYRLWDYLDRLQPARPQTLITAMQEGNIAILCLAALRHWRRTGDPIPAVAALSEVLRAEPGKPRSLDVFNAIRTLGEIGPAAAAAIPLLEEASERGRTAAAASIARIVDPGHPSVHQLLEDFDPELSWNNVGHILAAIETIGPRAKVLGPKIYRILTNGVHLESSISAGKALWAIEPRAGLLWAAICDHWLGSSLYSASYYLDGWTFSQLREVWPDFMEFVEEIAQSDPTLAATRLRSACSKGSPTVQVNACRLLWLVEPDVDFIVSTLGKVVTKLEEDGFLASLRWYCNIDFECRYGRHHNCQPEEEHYLVVAIAELIAAIGPSAKGAVASLLKFLASREYIHRIYAVFALRQLGPAARLAIPVLIEAVSTPLVYDSECCMDRPLIAKLREAAAETICHLVDCDHGLTALNRVRNNSYVWDRILTVIDKETGENIAEILHSIKQRYGG